MNAEIPENDRVEEVWRRYLTQGTLPCYVGAPWYETPFMRAIVSRMPSNPRCPICLFPFKGIGGMLTRVLTGRVPSRLNPRLCNECEIFARKYKGGAEVELSMLFADVRGSTGLAERMAPTAYGELISRFARTATGVLFHRNAMVEKFKGDEATGLFVPGFAGEQHARAAIEAGLEILRLTGHGPTSTPWIPVGVGVHTGTARVGAVEMEDGLAEIAALGDAANVAARLGSAAGPGELVVSEATYAAAGCTIRETRRDTLRLKGRSEPIAVRVIAASGKEPARQT